MPVIMMGGILAGIFTPTEAGVVACVYAYLVAKFLFKKMSWQDLTKAIVNAAKSSAVVMFVVATTQSLGTVITVARIPQQIAAAINSVSDNPLVIMCLINVFILGVGLFMDVVPALTIVAPIFLPIALGIGMDPVVFGITMIFGLVIGLITPPVGNVLYIGCGLCSAQYPFFYMHSRKNHYGYQKFAAQCTGSCLHHIYRFHADCQ